MTATLILFDPTAPRREPDHAGVDKPALISLAGKVVGFIDNAKPNFGLLADDLAQLLQTKYGVAHVVRHRKPSASVPAKPEVIEALSAECDVVITGSGD
jgi:hypothetical protein